MIVPQPQAAGDAAPDGSEVPNHALSDRLQGLEAVGPMRGMDAN